MGVILKLLNRNFPHVEYDGPLYIERCIDWREVQQWSRDTHFNKLCFLLLLLLLCLVKLPFFFYIFCFLSLSCSNSLLLLLTLLSSLINSCTHIQTFRADIYKNTKREKTRYRYLEHKERQPRYIEIFRIGESIQNISFSFICLK